MTRPRRVSAHQADASSLTHSRADNGITRRDVLALLAGFGVSDAAFAVSDKVIANDPVVVAPKSYRVMFENERVRILEYNNRPGLGPCGRGRHYHPAHLDVFLSEFSSKMTFEDGKTKTNRPTKVGQVAWFEAETHEVEIVDKSASWVIMVEFKDANWKPSTG